MTIELVRRSVRVATDPGSVETILSARGVTASPDDAYGLAGLLPPHAMTGLFSAASLVLKAINQRSRILIVGDYDADGATSVAVMIEGLKLLGAQEIDYLVPNRFEYGYGLSPELVDLALTKKPELMITVDQGIVSFEGVAAAKAGGVAVIVTDVSVVVVDVTVVVSLAVVVAVHVPHMTGQLVRTNLPITASLHFP